MGTINYFYTLFLILIIKTNNPLYTVNGQGPLRKVTNTVREAVNKIPFDRDLEISMSQTVVREGYLVEEHYTVTEDGYIVNLHRIPCGCNCTSGRGRGQPVLLIHGLASSARVWTLSGKEQGLAYVLADAGYDVWTGDLRGTDFSKAHMEYSINPRSPFWDFSWHEMGIYDLPAFIEFIYYKKGDEGYVSRNPNDLLIATHSLGGTATYVLFSVRPEYNKRVAAVFNFAPIGYTTFMRSPVRLSVPLTLLPLEDILFLLSGNEIAMDNTLMKSMVQLICSIPPVQNGLCEAVLFATSGFNPKEFNTTLLPRILNTLPAGTSSKVLIHYGQGILAGGAFRYYDYGPKGNLHAYGQITPPDYPLHKITVPIADYYGTRDYFATGKDIRNLDAQIPGAIGPFAIPFEHLDFLWGKDVVKLVYKPMIEIMRRYQ